MSVSKEKEKKSLTEMQKAVIESILSAGYRVQLIPAKDGVRVFKVEQKEIKS